MALAVALGLAASHAPAQVALVRPAMQVTVERAALLAEGASVMQINPWDSQGGPFDVIVCGPGALSQAGNPLALLSREGLTRIRNRLTERGVLALWFPAGRVNLETLLSTVATMSEVFPAFSVFVAGPEAVFVAVAEPSLQFARLKQVQDHLSNLGFWHPLDLVGGFAADAGDLAALAEGVSPYRLSHPRRPPALGRHLLGVPRAVTFAALVQHRVAGPGRLLQRLAFHSDNQRAVALRGFDAAYQDGTQDILRDVGRMSRSDPQAFVDFLSGPHARLDFFAPEGSEPAVRLGAALSAYGLHEGAAEVLREAIGAGQESFAVHMALAGVLEGLKRPADALQHYRQALERQPDSLRARGRLTALLLAAGLHREAAASLEEMVKLEPGNVAVLLMLANLYAGRLNRPDEAAELALRVLEIEPDNTAARDLLALVLEGGAADGGR
jgi:tetratricopeptide (TPR) repeat protein